MKNKIYMAGPLFSEAYVNQRVLEAKMIQKVIDENKTGHEVFSPINAPINDKSKLPSAEDIFLGDTVQLLESEVIFADLTYEDAGVMMELGMVILDEDVKIYPYLSDIRLGTAGRYDGNRVPFGYNQFVIGGLEYEGKILENLEKRGHKVYSSFQEALDAYKKDFSK